MAPRSLKKKRRGVGGTRRSATLSPVPRYYKGSTPNTSNTSNITIVSASDSDRYPDPAPRSHKSSMKKKKRKHGFTPVTASLARVNEQQMPLVPLREDSGWRLPAISTDGTNLLHMPATSNPEQRISINNDGEWEALYSDFDAFTCCITPCAVLLVLLLVFVSMFTSVMMLLMAWTSYTGSSYSAVGETAVGLMIGGLVLLLLPIALLSGRMVGLYRVEVFTPSLYVSVVTSLLLLVAGFCLTLPQYQFVWSESIRTRTGLGGFAITLLFLLCLVLLLSIWKYASILRIHPLLHQDVSSLQKRVQSLVLHSKNLSYLLEAAESEKRGLLDSFERERSAWRDHEQKLCWKIDRGLDREDYCHLTTSELRAIISNLEDLLEERDAQLCRQQQMHQEDVHLLRSKLHSSESRLVRLIEDTNNNQNVWMRRFRRQGNILKRYEMDEDRLADLRLHIEREAITRDCPHCKVQEERERLLQEALERVKASRHDCFDDIDKLKSQLQGLKREHSNLRMEHNSMEQIVLACHQCKAIHEGKRMVLRDVEQAHSALKQSEARLSQTAEQVHKLQGHVDGLENAKAVHHATTVNDSASVAATDNHTLSVANDDFGEIEANGEGGKILRSPKRGHHHRSHSHNSYHSRHSQHNHHHTKDSHHHREHSHGSSPGHSKSHSHK